MKDNKTMQSIAKEMISKHGRLPRNMLWSCNIDPAITMIWFDPLNSRDSGKDDNGFLKENNK